MLAAKFGSSAFAHASSYNASDDLRERRVCVLQTWAGFSPICRAFRDKSRPYLQGLSNYVYFLISHAVTRITDDPISAIRVLNFVCYFLVTAAIGMFLLRHHPEKGRILRSSRFWSCSHPAFLCFHRCRKFFATLFTVIAIATVLLTPNCPSSAALLAGIGLGLSAYIKPHAVAAVGGFAVFFFIYSLRSWSLKEWPRKFLPLR